MFLAIDPGTMMILIWFAVIVLAGIIEASTMDLTSIWFSAGAFVALIISIFWKELYVLQIVVFLVVSVLLLLGLRPVFKKYIKKNEIKTNADKLIGKIAICVKAIPAGERGEVKIDGKIWTAIANETIDINTRVEVLAIDGVKLVVKKGE
ncbi:MAG: NfeD family protein [Candidatus Izemoplasmatales bacterium]|jgi:membrane protein implicated in regulation of membrane protease activity|nr:NfeD family protein [Candidatus Izemoplasmatales bacterium]